MYLFNIINSSEGKALERKKCGQELAVNGQMLSNTLKAFTFPDGDRQDYFNRITCVWTESLEAYFFLDFLFRFVSRQNEKNVLVCWNSMCIAN